MSPVMYDSQMQIVQSPGYVHIMVEMMHDTRIIRAASSRDVTAASLDKCMGDSIGRWEGDTLIVETKHYNPLQKYRDATTENLTVI